MANAIDFLTDLILRIDGIPEDAKIELRLINALDRLFKALKDGFDPYVMPRRPGAYRESLLPLRQEVLEYIQLMEVGLNSFLAAHPIPTEEQ